MKKEKINEMTIAYMRRTGEYGPKNKELMEIFKGFLKKRGLMTDETVILAVALDDPAKTPPEKQRYDVGIVWEKDENISLDKRKLVPGIYAVFETEHTSEAAVSFWEDIIKTDLPVDWTKPVIERYSAQKISKGLCEFCVPLK